MTPGTRRLLDAARHDPRVRRAFEFIGCGVEARDYWARCQLDAVFVSRDGDVPYKPQDVDAAAAALRTADRVCPPLPRR